MSDDTAVNSYDRLSYKYNQVIPFVSFNYNRDDGLYLGFSLKFIRHGFRKSPYKTMHQFMVNHSLATNAFNFRYYSEYIGILGKTGDLLTDIDIKAPDNTTNFFGYGDNSIYDKTKPGEFRFYRARYNLGDVSVLIRKRFSDKLMFMFGPTYEFYKLNQDDNIGKNIVLTGTNGLDATTLYAKQSFFGGRISFSADTRDDKVVPQKGINWTTSFRYLYGLNDKSSTIAQLNSEFSFFVQLARDKLVFANRAGAGVNFGNFEFFQAQYLGGDEYLRGYRKYRFAGKSMIFNNAELRLRVANFRTYLFPAAFGLLAFYDAGRVYDKNTVSNKWLSGYGGGVWISPLKRLVLTLSYTASKEDKLPLIGLGWKF
jgi:hemolysin activation/secretion protein